jgi:choline dehydrogenase
VEYVRDGRVERAVAAREVVVAAGTIGSPQLLMLSGIGPAAELEAHGVAVAHELPGVGQNLQDHLAVGAIVAARQPISLASAETPGQLLRYLLLRRGMLTSNVGEACAFVRSAADVPAPDLELLFAPVPFENHGLTPPTSHGFTVGVVLLQPKSRGAVGLRSADSLARPRIVANYLSDPGGDDLRRMVQGLRLARHVLGMPALAPLVGDPVQPGPDVRSEADLARFVRERAETLYHPVGTCRMGVDEMAVVDPSLRVHGLDGLRVVDASVMPTIIRGHTNAPTIMIAEKGAELMRA